jgi:hypothetical protein
LSSSACKSSVDLIIRTRRSGCSSVRLHRSQNSFLTMHAAALLCSGTSGRPSPSSVPQAWHGVGLGTGAFSTDHEWAVNSMGARRGYRTCRPLTHGHGTRGTGTSTRRHINISAPSGGAPKIDATQNDRRDSWTDHGSTHVLL